MLYMSLLIEKIEKTKSEFMIKTQCKETIKYGIFYYYFIVYINYLVMNRLICLYKQ